jgi:azurin
MKITVGKMCVLLAIVLSLVAVQAVWARTCNVNVSGEVTAIDYDNNAITIAGTTVYGIPLPYLANKLNIVLQVGDYVVLTATQCPSTGKLSACTLSVNDGNVINLPGGRSR